jgi:hypothetical protein
MVEVRNDVDFDISLDFLPGLTFNLDDRGCSLFRNVSRTSNGLPKFAVPDSEHDNIKLNLKSNNCFTNIRVKFGKKIMIDKKGKVIPLIDLGGL